MHGIKISKCKISNTIYWEGKKTVNPYFYMEKRLQTNIRKNMRSVTYLSKVKILVTRENPVTQKPIAKSFNTSAARIIKIKKPRYTA